MGIGPVEAVRTALARSGLKKDDIDLWDVNEVCGVVVTRDSCSLNAMCRLLRRNGWQCRKSLSFRTTRVTCSEEQSLLPIRSEHLARGTYPNRINSISPDRKF